MPDRPAAPRGRHAPPLEVRLDQQRRRLFRAAAAVFARQGYADASAEAIAREAGMSKATFYEHFDNKEDCIVAVFDASADSLLEVLRSAWTGADRRERVRSLARTFFAAVAANPAEAQTMLVEIIGAGPRAIERRDRVLADFAEFIDERNREDAEAGVAPRFPSPHDSFAIVGAVFELASRHVRTGEPRDLRELETVLERLVLGLFDEHGARPA